MSCRRCSCNSRRSAADRVHIVLSQPLQRNDVTASRGTDYSRAAADGGIPVTPSTKPLERLNVATTRCVGHCTAAPGVRVAPVLNEPLQHLSVASTSSALHGRTDIAKGQCL